MILLRDWNLTLVGLCREDACMKFKDGVREASENLRICKKISSPGISDSSNKCTHHEKAE